MTNNTFYAPNDYRLYLEHHGIKGMRWGIRRFQNPDGSYTSAGRSRYGIGDGKAYNTIKGGVQRTASTIGSRVSGAAKAVKGKVDDIRAKEAAMTPEEKAARNAKVAKVAAIVAGTAAVAAGAYFGHKYMGVAFEEATSYVERIGSKQVDKLFNELDKYWEKSTTLEDLGSEQWAQGNTRAAKNSWKMAKEYSRMARDAGREFDDYHNKFNSAVGDRRTNMHVVGAMAKRAAKSAITNAVVNPQINRQKAKNGYYDPKLYQQKMKPNADFEKDVSRIIKEQGARAYQRDQKRRR